MFTGIRRWLGARHPSAEAVQAALRQFNALGGREALEPMCAVIHRDDSCAVVRVCYGNTRPPQRVWYRVPADGSAPRVMTFDDVVPLGERPWR